jgi:rod shape-determining protein MreD
MIRRILVVVGIILTALLLQSTVFSQLRLVGVKPELVYAVTVLVAILEGPNQGAVVGFVGGMAQDFLLNAQPKGLTALTLTLLGYALGMIRTYVVSPSPLLPAMLVGVGTAVGVAFYQTLAFLLGQLSESVGYALQVTVLTGAYGAILTPIVFPVVRRAIEGSRPTRVVRF